jgi:hypothetical protein
MNHGLNLLTDRIEAEWRIAREDSLRFGATRKSNISKASQYAAIGWLAEGVHRITGRPHYREVCELAEVILGLAVSIDNARWCARQRKREWRLSLTEEMRRVRLKTNARMRRRN